MELLKLLSANEIVAQILSFLLLLFVLRLFMWKRMLAILDGRRRRIETEFKRIESAKQELEEVRSEYMSQIESIDLKAKEMMRDAAERGKKAFQEIIKKAELEADEIIDNARVNVRYELDAARESLKDDIVKLTIAAAENVIEKKLTAEDDKKIINKFLDELGGAN